MQGDRTNVARRPGDGAGSGSVLTPPPGRTPPPDEEPCDHTDVWGSTFIFDDRDPRASVCILCGARRAALIPFAPSASAPVHG